MIAVCVILCGINVSAKDNLTQYPFMLKDSYFGINPGYIYYPFTNEQLNPGYTAAQIVRPGYGLRLVYGHKFNKYLSAQISYMRPVLWVEYRNVNGDNLEHSVFMNSAGLTVKGTLPVYKKLSVYGEAGLNLATRSGFDNRHDTEILSSTNYASYQLGAGLQLPINKRWDLAAGVVYAAGKKDVKQPYTLFYSLGVIYNMKPLSDAMVKRNSEGGVLFPKNTLQLGFATNGLGYGVNYWFTKRPIPIFWDGNIRVEKGTTIQYSRLAFHGRKFFSLYWGLNASVYETELNHEQFFAASIFPMIRFTPVRTKSVDFYFNYCAASPTFISGKKLDNLITGESFTFYDFMGIGANIGKRKNLNFEFRIAHYSNGNLFYHNPGVLLPLTFNLGYSF